MFLIDGDVMKTVQRTIKVPIDLPKPKEWDKTWVALRRLAMFSASFANEMLNEKYAQAKGVKYEKTAYKDWNEELGSYTRDAVTREVQGMWQRNGKKIMRGDQTLGRFTADRCLCCRERGVHLQPMDGTFQIKLTFEPSKSGQAFRFDVWKPALAKDHYLRGTLDRLASGVHEIAKASVLFERPGRKVFVCLSYSKEIDEVDAGGHVAKVLVDDDGGIYVSCEGQMLTLGCMTTRLRAMKEHFAAIQHRLRHDLGRRGRYDRMRQVMRDHQTFDDWADGPLHQMSHQIVAWCAARSVGQIVWAIPEESGLPSTRLMSLCDYKAAELGMVVFSQTRAEKEQKAELRKQRAIERAQSEASEDVSEGVSGR